MNVFFSYIKKLISKTVFAILLLADVISFAVDWILKGFDFPSYYYWGLLILGVFIASFQIYLESNAENIDVRISLKHLKYLQNNEYQVTLLNIDLDRIEKRVRAKIDSLEQVYADFLHKNKINSIFDMGWDVPGNLNHAYQIDVKKYENKYRGYLSLQENIDFRFFGFYPTIKNTSNISLTDVYIEFVIDKPLKIPDTDMYYRYLNYGSSVLPPPEPELLKNKKPNLKIQDTSLFYRESNIASGPIDKKNISGPYFDKAERIYYKIDKLIPDHLEIDFEPFFLWFTDIFLPQEKIIPIEVFCSESSEHIKKEIRFKIEFEDI